MDNPLDPSAFSTGGYSQNSAPIPGFMGRLVGLVAGLMGIILALLCVLNLFILWNELTDASSKGAAGLAQDPAQILAYSIGLPFLFLATLFLNIAAYRLVSGKPASGSTGIFPPLGWKITGGVLALLGVLMTVVLARAGDWAPVLGILPLFVFAALAFRLSKTRAAGGR